MAEVSFDVDDNNNDNDNDDDDHVHDDHAYIWFMQNQSNSL